MPWPDTCSAVQLGALLGVSARRIRELAEAGTIPRKGGRYPVAAAVAAYCENLREVAAGRRGESGDALDLTQERALLARSQREHVELKLARERGELVNAAEVERHYVGLVTAARNRLRGVPSKAKGKCTHFSVRDIEVLEDLIDDALREIVDGGDAAAEEDAA